MKNTRPKGLRVASFLQSEPAIDEILEVAESFSERRHRAVQVCMLAGDRQRFAQRAMINEYRHCRVGRGGARIFQSCLLPKVGHEFYQAKGWS
jgi:hypothetical protein